MSRLTASQVIALGEYLSPDFNPAVLTVSQLLGVLGFHNIQYPSPYTKPKLIQLFNDEIKAKSTKLKRERLKKESSQASDDGITDGVTGQLIGEQRLAPRRSSRRISRAPSDEEEILPARPDPPKRRRSSAQPNLGGPSRTKASIVQPTLTEGSEPEGELPIHKAARSKKTSDAAGRGNSSVQPKRRRSSAQPNLGGPLRTKAALAQPPLAEESEPDEESPIRKVRRSKKTSEAAGSQARRVSGTAGEDSGWEDNNIFQSGAESSSPLRPAGKAALQEVFGAESSSPLRPAGKAALQEVFEEVDREYKLGSEDDGLDQEDEGEEGLDLEDEVNKEDEGLDRDDGEEDMSVAISRRIADGGKSLARRRTSISPESKLIPLLTRILLTFVAMVISGAVVNYKMESAPIGYCDTHSNTNNALEELKHKWNAVEACNRENRTLLYLPSLSKHGQQADVTPCPPLPLVPLWHPTTCTPCPEHATCTQHSVTCDTGYLLRPHPLLFFLPPSSAPTKASLVPPTFASTSELVWKLISEATDGLPGLGSVGLPHKCVEDPRRKRNIGVLGKTVEAMLGQERGRRLCSGKVSHIEDQNGGEARMWGIELEMLKRAMKRKAPAHLLVTFEDTFNEAIQQLIQWGGIVISEDAGGKQYVAHKTPNLTWNCALTVTSREAWAEWRMTVFGVIIVILSGYAWRARRAQRQNENKRVAELVQVTLDTLRNQELAHHTDPITATQPYLSSLQLRDLILQEEHSIQRRQRLWGRVEAIVEGNANVRANLEEVRGGDEMRVWRWIGGGSEIRKRVGPVSDASI